MNRRPPAGESVSSEAIQLSSELSVELSDEKRQERKATLAGRSATRCLSVLVIAHAVLLTYLANARHEAFRTFAFDLGIYDQAWWMLGHQAGTFSTMRGLPVFGHHVNLVLYLLAPLSWLGLGTVPLVAVQSAALSAGALPVSWIARRKIGTPIAGLVFGVVYLLYPPTSWLSWVSFHPESLAVLFVFLAMWFAQDGRWVKFAVCIGLALSTREEVGLLVGLYGLILVAQSYRRVAVPKRTRLTGLLTAVAGFGWFLLCTKVIIPHHLNGDAAFYVGYFFGSYGDSMGEVVKHLALHPGEIVAASTTASSRTFLLDLIGPLGFLPLFGFPWVLLAGPQMATTLIGQHEFLRMITNQYTALMVPGFVAGSIEVVAWIKRRWPRQRNLPKICLTWLVMCSVAFAFARGPLPGAKGYSAWIEPRPNVAAMADAVKLIPASADVIASNEIAPHLSQRKTIYMFPNPFERILYGLGDAQLAKPLPPDSQQVTTPMWIIVNLEDLSLRRQRFVRSLQNDSRWVTVFDQDEVVVLRPIESQFGTPQA